MNELAAVAIPTTECDRRKARRWKTRKHPMTKMPGARQVKMNRNKAQSETGGLQ
jgi:hypothetical protein